MSDRTPPKGVLDHLVPRVRDLGPATLDVDATMRTAIAHHQRGHLHEAEKLCRQVLITVPRHADALDFLGVIAWQSGRVLEALEFIGQALSLNKRNPKYHLHYGLTLVAADRRPEAIKSLRFAVKLAPSLDAAHYNLGLALHQDGQLQAAIRSFRKAVRFSPRNVMALNNLGTALAEVGDLEEAETTLRRAIHLKSNSVSIYNTLASVLLELGRGDDALATVGKGHKIEETAEGHFVVAQVFQNRAEFKLAHKHYGRALELAPDMLPARVNLGNVLFDYGRMAKDPKERERILNEAKGLIENPRNLISETPELQFNHAKILGELGRDDEALKVLDRLVASHPDRYEALYLRSLNNLRRGESTNGAKEFQMFWLDPNSRFTKRPFDFPWWSGETNLKNQRLLIWGDQGIGDQILYARFLPLLELTGIEALVEIDPRLGDIFRRSFRRVTVVPQKKIPVKTTGASNIAFQTPISGLMYCLGPWPEGFPRSDRYLETEPKRVIQHQKWLENSCGTAFRVGISWISKRVDIPPEGFQKSVELLQWEPILRMPGAAFVNLQYGDTDAEISFVKEKLGVTIHTDPTVDRFNDIESLAALIESLDLVITISNVTAHIAASLGKDCLVLVRKSPLWYWLNSGDRAALYNSVRVLRQSWGGEWGSVIREAAAVLSRRMEPLN